MTLEVTRRRENNEHLLVIPQRYHIMLSIFNMSGENDSRFLSVYASNALAMNVLVL